MAGKVKLRNKELGYEIPVKGHFSEYNEHYYVILPGEPRGRHWFRKEDFDLIVDFDFPTKKWAVISCVNSAEYRQCFQRRYDHSDWVAVYGDEFSEDYLLHHFHDFKVEFEGVDA